MAEDETNRSESVPAVGRRGRRGLTLKDIGDQLGITPMAVSLALNNKPGVSAALRATVREYAAEHGYRPDAAARTLRTRRSYVLGLANRNLRNPAFLSVIEGFTKECAQSGFQVLVATTGLDVAREESVIDAFAAHQVDGLAISPITPERTLDMWRSRSSAPVALINHMFPASAEGVLSVRSHLRDSVRLAMEHVVELGHHRIAVLTDGPIPSPGRAAEFTRLARRAGVDVVDVAISDFSPQTGQLVEVLKARNRPTAVIAASDALAHHVYDVAAVAGLRIPEDLSVVGHDDLPTSHLLRPALTTIAVDGVGIGRAAARMLIDSVLGNVDEERQRELPVRLIVRESTASAQNE